MKVAVPSEVNQVLVITRRRGKKVEQKASTKVRPLFLPREMLMAKRPARNKVEKLDRKYKFNFNILITSVYIKNLSYGFP